MEPANVPTQINNDQPIKEPTLIPAEDPMEIQNTPTLVLGLPSRAIISQDDVEDTPNCYNMQSISQSITQSIIEPHIMPTLKLNTPNNKLNQKYSSSAQALQINEL